MELVTPIGNTLPIRKKGKGSPAKEALDARDRGFTYMPDDDSGTLYGRFGRSRRNRRSRVVSFRLLPKDLPVNSLKLLSDRLC
jgi:hypothetical protein